MILKLYIPERLFFIFGLYNSKVIFDSLEVKIIMSEL